MESLTKPSGDRRLECESFPTRWMWQRELGSMQEERVALTGRSSIATVANYRVADVAKMSPDLVRPTGVQRQLQQRTIAARLEHLVVGTGILAALINEHLWLIRPRIFAQPERHINRRLSRIGNALDDRNIGLLNQVFPKRIGKRARTDRRQPDHQQAGRAAIQTMHRRGAIGRGSGSERLSIQP